MFVRPFVRLSVPPHLEAQIPALRLKSQPQGSNPSLEARIPASSLKSQLDAQICTHGWTNERTKEQKSPCVLQDIVPFRAAALLTITYIDKAGQRITLTTYCPWATGCTRHNVMSNHVLSVVSSRSVSLSRSLLFI